MTNSAEGVKEGGLEEEEERERGWKGDGGDGKSR